MRKILSILAVAILATGSLFGQAAASGAARGGNSETRVFAMELGTGLAYDVTDQTTSATQAVAAAFGLSDSVQAGFQVIKGDTTTHSFSLIKVAVYPLTDLAVNLEFGSNGDAEISNGFGVSYNMFRNTTSGLGTALQGNIGYRFSEVDKGILVLSLNLKAGL